jgi:hypothetical protein
MCSKRYENCDGCIDDIILIGSNKLLTRGTGEIFLILDSRSCLELHYRMPSRSQMFVPTVPVPVACWDERDGDKIFLRAWERTSFSQSRYKYECSLSLHLITSVLQPFLLCSSVSDLTAASRPFRPSTNDCLGEGRSYSDNEGGLFNIYSDTLRAVTMI